MKRILTVCEQCQHLRQLRSHKYTNGWLYFCYLETHGVLWSSEEWSRKTPADGCSYQLEHFILGQEDHEENPG